MTKHPVSKAAIGSLILLCLLFGVATASDVEDNLTYQGGKARVVVGNIKPKADMCSNEMAAAIGEMLSTALTNTGKFIVLASQEEVAELAEEIDFAQSGYVEEGRGPEAGLMEGADILITGAVTSFEPDAGGGGGGLSGLKKKAFGSLGVSSKTAKMQMELKLIDIRTRRIIKAKKIKAESKSWSTDMAGGGWTDDISLDGALGIYSNEPMEKAVRASLAKSVTMISKEVPKEYYRYTGQGQYTQEYGTPAQAAAPAQAAPAQAASAPSAAAPAAQAPAAAPAAPAAEDMTLYTKYDFVPGDKVIFYDDLSDEEEGEFPYRWDLVGGVFEIARMGGEYWILCTNRGTIIPKMPTAPLPEKYTVELEVYCSVPGKSIGSTYIRWLDADKHSLGEFSIGSTANTNLELKGRTVSNKPMPEHFGKGSQVMRIMATSRSIKCYVNEVRVANVPKVEDFNPTGFAVYLTTSGDKVNPSLIRNFRFAEGGKSMREQLDEDGKIVTHGILFDPDSYVIKAESYKTLKDIGRLFEDDPSLRLSIEGHTDSDGSDDHNLSLSQNRANAVLNFLTSNFGVQPGQLEAKGWGESKPIDVNTTAEGKANNRRVELVKL